MQQSSGELLQHLEPLLCRIMAVPVDARTLTLAGALYPVVCDVGSRYSPQDMRWDEASRLLPVLLGRWGRLLLAPSYLFISS